MTHQIDYARYVQQEREAMKWMNDYLKRLLEEGFVETSPGFFVKRKEDGSEEHVTT